MSAINYSPAYYGDYEFPGYAQAMGWLMVCSPLALIIIVMIAQIIRKGVCIRSLSNVDRTVNNNVPSYIPHFSLYLLSFQNKYSLSYAFPLYVYIAM